LKRTCVKPETRGVQGPAFEDLMPRAIIILFISLSLLVLPSSRAQGEMQRRINIGMNFNYYALDSDFFGLDNGVGAVFVFRYEIANNIYFENGLGTFSSDAAGVDIDGTNYHLDVLALLPYLIPYRPMLRAGMGFISVNPITATPTDTYRPAQTTFYLLAGTGLTRTLRENILVEASIDLYFTPYDYRIYEFDRSSVSTRDARFLHFIYNIGISYAF
jgi:hypothetical protein